MRRQTFNFSIILLFFMHKIDNYENLEVNVNAVQNAT